MTDWSVSAHRNGKNVLTKMVKEGCKRSVAYVYGQDKKPLGTVTYEIKSFDPNTGD